MMVRALLTCVLLVWGTHAFAEPQPASPAAPAAPPAVPSTYGEYIAKAMTREALADFAAAVDRAVEQAEAPRQPDGLAGPRVAESGLGLRVDISVVSGKQATLYHLSLSRGGQELRFSDAAKFIAFVADRAGLPHPITIREGERPVFYAQWLFKPSDWKKEKEWMLKVRERNRSEKDALKAFALAISREIRARQTTEKDR